MTAEGRRRERPAGGDGVRRGSDARDCDPSMGVPPEANLACHADARSALEDSS